MTKINFNKKISLFFLFFLLFLLSFGLLWKNHFKEIFLTKYLEIDVKPLIEEKKSNSDWENGFSPFVNEEGKFLNKIAVLRGISPTNPGLIRLSFKKPISFDGFSIFFPGNFHSVSSMLAKEFEVYYLNEKNELILLDRVKNNQKPFYWLKTRSRITTTDLRIIVTKPAFYDENLVGEVWYNNIKFFKKETVNLWNGFKYFLESRNTSLAAYWFYYLIFLLVLFLPGEVIIYFYEKQKNIKIDPDFKLIISPIFSLILLSSGIFFYVISGNKILLNIFWLFFLLAILIFLKDKIWQQVWKGKIPLLFILVALMINFLTIAHRDYLFNMQYIGKSLDSLRPIPREGYIGYFADNYYPWRIARVYSNRMPLSAPETKNLLGETSLFDRTPLYPMMIAGILNLFGEGHFVYQRLIEVIGVIIYGVYYVLFKKYFSPRIALLSSFLLILNVQLSWMPFNAEFFYKYFSVYPILIAYILVLTKQDFNKFIIAFLVGLSFLIHPHTGFYGLTLLVLYFFRYRNIKKFIKATYPILFCLFFLFILWIVLPILFQGNPGKRLGPTFNKYFSEENMIPDGNLFLNKIINLINLFVPNFLLDGVQGGKISFFSREFIAEILRYSIVTNLTPAFFILFIFFLVKKFKEHLEIIVLGIVPLLLFWLIYLNKYNFYFHYGGLYFTLYPATLPMMFACAVSYLRKTKRFVRKIVFASYSLFMAINLYYISGNFHGQMKCASLTVNLLFYLIILTYFIMSLFLIKIGGKTRIR